MNAITEEPTRARRLLLHARRHVDLLLTASSMC
ncbi:tmRNA-binding protein [Friedmanniella endophytica]|uniref:TmRNA-binding protein n=1 Tax=Microlunatus kandeliicorticis TaxID=1759536 RepID=A0A7W3IVY3_9ACTN|nr:tmRNA-binding protein [Microlunatus kandeliicorticis]